LSPSSIRSRSSDPATASCSITNQIDANIKRTAFSPYIYEYNDFAVGLVGADGQLIAQCTGGMPPFVADSVGMAVRDGLEIYGQGAACITATSCSCNHAAVQGQHLNNTVMYTPIYAGPDHATLIGFFAINVHWIEIGGIQTNSTDIFMEGCSCARSSCGRRASRSKRSTASSRTTPACRTS
jgi:N-methylhydantoinase B